MSSMKREKCKNFTESEMNALLGIIEAKKSIIESKVTNGSIIQKKLEAWQDIVDTFNATAETPRTVKQLKTLYENLKRKARKDVAEVNKENYEQQLRNLEGIRNVSEAVAKSKHEEKNEKVEVYKTGGGTFEGASMTGTSEQILAILGDKVLILCNPYDSTAVYHNDVIIENSVEVFEPFLEPEHEMPDVPDPPAQKKISRPTIIKKNKQKIKISEVLKRNYFRQKLKNSIFEAKAQRILFKWDLKIKKLQFQKLNN